MEEVEPKTVWILLMGYQVDEITLDTYAQYLLSKLVDEKEERFGTFKEKDLILHKYLTEFRRKRKVRKEAEQLAEKMGITREAVQRAREKNILKEEDLVKQQAKKVPIPSKQAKAKPSKSSPTSGAQKEIAPPKPQSTSTSGAEKRKKENPVIKYATTKEETKSNKEVREVKKTATHARVFQKPPLGESQPTNKTITQGEQSGKARSGKKQKYELDESLKSGKLDESYTIVPPLTLSELINQIVKEGNLKNVLVYYENCDESEQRSIEEAIIEYLNTYSKVLLEISSIILKDLYDILDARRHATSLEDERLK